MYVKKTLKVFDLIEKYLLLFGSVILLVMMIITSLDATFRYFFNFPLPGIFELIQEYLMPYLVFLTMSYVFSIGGHVRVTILTDHLPKLLNRIVMSIFNLFTAIMFLLIGYGAYIRTVTAFRLNELSSSILAYPLGPAYAVVIIGSVFMAVRLIFAAVISEQPEPLIQ